jgi:hypothetical protein
VDLSSGPHWPEGARGLRERLDGQLKFLDGFGSWQKVAHAPDDA